jgi:hypothetical protein
MDYPYILSYKIHIFSISIYFTNKIFHMENMAKWGMCMSSERNKIIQPSY